MRRYIQFSAAVMTLAACAQVGRAELNFQAGNHAIAPAASQVIDLYVSGGEAIHGFNLALQVGDASGGPLVSQIDLESGIFASNNDGQLDDGSDALFKFYSIVVANNASPVTGNGLLVRLTLDATNVEPGDYAIKIAGLATPLGTYDSVFFNGNADFINASLSNGTITVLPEPATFMAIGLAAIPLLRRRRR